MNENKSPFQETGKKESSIELILAKSLERIVDMLDKITEFNQNDLKAISMIQSIQPLKDLTDYWILNKKHIKRKHSSEVLKGLKYISQTISGMNNDEKSSFLSNIFNRKE